MPNSHYRVLLLEDNPVNALVVRKTLEASEGPTFNVSHADSLVKALDFIAAGSFDAALVDLNLPDSSGIETFLALQRSAPALPVIILSGCDDDSLAIKAVELGAQDYLSKSSFSGTEIVRALQYGIARSRNMRGDRAPNDSLGSILAFLGSKGGVGATTLACYTAREWKRQREGKLLVTGIDPMNAGVAYLMKASSQYTLADAAWNLHRLDSDLWKAYVHATPDGIHVLSPPGAGSNGAPIEADRIRHVLRSARGLYAKIILDLGTLNPVSLSLLEDVADLIVISGEDLPSLWEAGRLLNHLTTLGLPREKVRFVLNQKKRRDGVSADELEKALNYPIFATVTSAWIDESDLMAGGRFIDEKSPLRKDIAALVAKLMGTEPAKPGRFSLGRLMGR